MKYPQQRFTVLLALLIALSGCHRAAKAPVYTTTLEGIQVHVPTLTGGIISSMKVQEGSLVRKGDTLAVMDDREIRYQLEQADAALAELAVQQGIAQNTLAQAKSDEGYAAQRTGRLQTLEQEGGIAQQNVDDAQNMLNRARTQEKNASNQTALLGASKERLEAQRKTLVKKLGDTVIVSPASGMVTTLYFQQGEATTPFANLMEITDVSRLDAKAYVGEQRLAAIRIGETVKVKTASGKVYNGTVIYVNNKAEFTPKNILTPDTRSAMVYAVTVRVVNTDGFLKDGMPVEVDF